MQLLNFIHLQSSLTNRIIQSKIYSHLKRTEDLLVACNEIESSYYYFFSYRFCARDFSDMRRPIFLKFSWMIDINVNLIVIFLFFVTSNITSDIDVFVDFQGSACPRVFSETTKDINFKFSAIVEENLQICRLEVKFC